MRTNQVIRAIALILMFTLIAYIATQMNPSESRTKDKAINLPEEIQLAEPGDNLRVYKVTSDSIYLEYNNINPLKSWLQQQTK